MSASEAKARILAAAAARAISEEQMRMVNESEIVGAENLIAIHNQLAQLPADELMFIVKQLVLDSEHLGEENLANLASLLGSSHMEVEVRKE